MVVLVIAGAIMAITFQALSSILDKQINDKTSYEMATLFKYTRDYALGNGKIYTLELDLEKRNMGVREFHPELETEIDSSLQELWENRSQYLYTEEDRKRLGIQIKDNTSTSFENPTDEEDKEDIEVNWVIEKQSMPANLKKVYSVTGLELKGPLIYVHFYPNGTSDSLIFFYKGQDYPYLFLPRQGSRAVYLKKLRIGKDSET